MRMKVYLNRSQLARRLGIAAATLARWIVERKIQPDAIDGKGRQLFDAEKHETK